MGEVEVDPGIEAVRVMSGDHGVEVLREILAELGESAFRRFTARSALRYEEGLADSSAGTNFNLVAPEIEPIY
jgi:hypothetical protein